MEQYGLTKLKNMIYAGRGIGVGRLLSGEDFFVYFLTGRSPPSQARIFKIGDKTQTVSTQVTNAAELEKGSPALLLYPAFVQTRNIAILSNGAQTKLVYSALMNNLNMADYPSGILKEAFKQPFWEYDPKDDRWIDITSYEPDFPNNTPRITAYVTSQNGAIHIVRKGLDDKKVENEFSFPLTKGLGKLITTYGGGNESPLLPFSGDPLELIVSTANLSSREDIAETFYDAIKGGVKSEENYRVAVAVMMRDKSGFKTPYMINRAERGN